MDQEYSLSDYGINLFINFNDVDNVPVELPPRIGSINMLTNRFSYDNGQFSILEPIVCPVEEVNLESDESAAKILHFDKQNKGIFSCDMSLLKLKATADDVDVVVNTITI